MSRLTYCVRCGANPCACDDDDLPRFRTEIRTCMCGVAYSVTWDRHSLDNGSRACAACCELTFSLHGVTEYGSAVCLLDGTLMSAGKRTEWCTDHATIRRWAADAAAHGVSKITLRISRHTRRLGTHERRWIKFGAAS